MHNQTEVRLLPDRACGTCTLCCKVPYIKEFDKPPGVWCQHAAPGRGCMSYADRPHSCRAFYCLWRQDPGFGPEWKPDRAKFVTYLQHNAPNIWVAVDPGFPNAWTRAPYYDRLKTWARHNAERGGFVFARIGARVIAILPDRDADIGSVGLDDEVLVARRMTPAGYAYEVKVRRRQTDADQAMPAALAG
jgi:hypothetical protein